MKNEVQSKDGQTKVPPPGSMESYHSVFATIHNQHPITGKVEVRQVLHSGISCRAAAAIMLKVPRSGVTWLDQMIRDARVLDLAERLYLQGKDGGLTAEGAGREAQAFDSAAKLMIGEDA